MTATFERINPSSMVPPMNCTHIAKVPASANLAFISGQAAYTRERELVSPGDYYGQTKQVMENILLAVEGAGGKGWEDLVKVTYFVVDISPEAMEGLVRGMREVLGEAFENPPAASLVGVQALYHPDLLLEVEAIALVP